MAQITKDIADDLRKALRLHYEETLETNLWKKIGISHMTFLQFMYPEHSNNEPIYKTCARVKRFLDSIKKG